MTLADNVVDLSNTKNALDGLIMKQNRTARERYPGEATYRYPSEANRTRLPSLMEEEEKLIGWRYIDKYYEQRPCVGDRLANSFVWLGDEITSDELPGTCAFATREACEKYAEYSHGCGWIVEIAGDHVRSGDLTNEIILSDAIVQQIIDW